MSNAMTLPCVAFYRATRMLSEDYAVARCLSVCSSVRLSVTRRYSVETAKHIIKVYAHHASFSTPIGITFRREPTPNGDVECTGVGL